MVFLCYFGASKSCFQVLIRDLNFLGILGFFITYPFIVPHTVNTCSVHSSIWFVTPLGMFGVSSLARLKKLLNVQRISKMKTKICAYLQRSCMKSKRCSKNRSSLKLSLLNTGKISRVLEKLEKLDCFAVSRKISKKSKKSRKCHNGVYLRRINTIQVTSQEFRKFHYFRYSVFTTQRILLNFA